MNRMISAAETAMVVLATLFFCVSMTIPADTMRGFDKLFDLMMLGEYKVTHEKILDLYCRS